MSYSSIKAKCIAVSGIKDDLFAKRLVNDAAREVYESADLKGSLKEAIIYFSDTDTKLFSIPFYMQNIRAARWYGSQAKIQITDIAPRFQDYSWGLDLLDWREIGESTLNVQVDNASTLRFVLPIEETEAVTITVVGKTPNSERLSETVTIAAGTLEIETANDFVIAPVSITKNRTTTYDINILDADGDVVGKIPNHQLVSRYVIYQVRDDSIQGMPEISGVEILYKEQFQTFENDNDSLLSDRYDDAIYWKFMEHHHAQTKDGLQNALAARAKAEEIIVQNSINLQRGKKLKFEYVANKFYGLWKSGYRFNLPWSR